MTTSPSSGGRRHRGRRGRRSGNRAQQQHQHQQPQAQPGVPEAISAPPADIVVNEAVPEQAVAPPQGPRGGEGEGRPRGDRGGRNLRGRRQPPRQPMGPMPTEVLKRHVKVGAPEYPLQMRPVAGLVEEHGANFGCPMLQRNMTAMPATGNQMAPRCSLGWSLRDEHEAHYCMHTPDLLECWKAHPEKIPVLDERIEAERNATQAAD